jgi:hypothetical protein
MDLKYVNFHFYFIFKSVFYFKPYKPYIPLCQEIVGEIPYDFNDSVMSILINTGKCVNKLGLKNLPLQNLSQLSSIDVLKDLKLPIAVAKCGQRQIIVLWLIQMAIVFKT